MQENSEVILINVVIEKFTRIYLPRALELKQRVDKGGVLVENDIHFLKIVFADAKVLKNLILNRPEYKKVASSIFDFYFQITSAALENEKGQ